MDSPSRNRSPDATVLSKRTVAHFEKKLRAAQYRLHALGDQRHAVETHEKAVRRDISGFIARIKREIVANPQLFPHYWREEGDDR